ncbi:ABC transporter substrate-binding protein [Streptomyces bacillaris]|uniref:ABC transporter substrate-binding protein n=1 Tax=Streptomyces cavourensis TaxID=67258 RepID=A0ABY5F8H3_9ACTN|nr:MULTISPECIES: ABC transporter substrate-binding protein [Streptomyces]ATY99754.1 iron transporter [Streptomyces cavourensis]NUV42534.1 ABC transporter substrate-binding protein [Streptomyces sp. CAI-24]NUV81147.1 ABC transporter substrate-binding protein [Streptomyces sp. CAI-155]UTR79977.1 ABC transporter substrate-binding protein [Streptomyces cavourensis]
MPNPTRPAAFLLAAALALTGCGADVTTQADGKDGTAETDRHYPVTVENCGEKRTFAKAPQRVVTNDVGITEIMFALGLENHMAGYVMPDDKGDMTSVSWKDGYKKTKWLSKERINKELVLDADADLVFAGWNYGFNEGEGFTPAELKRVGVDSYLLSESCRNGQGKARGVMPPLDALYTDLRNLGKIFDVEDRAESLITSFRKQVADAQAKAPKGDDRPRVFLYDDGRDKPLTSGAYAGPHDIITKAGGDHIMKDLKDSWTTVGWETVVDRDPEVIVINNYGDTTADQKRAFLKSYKPLANVSAIKNDRIVVLDYVDLVESPRNPAAISSLAEDLRTFAQ